MEVVAEKKSLKNIVFAVGDKNGNCPQCSNANGCPVNF